MASSFALDEVGGFATLDEPASIRAFRGESIGIFERLGTTDVCVFVCKDSVEMAWLELSGSRFAEFCISLAIAERFVVALNALSLALMASSPSWLLLLFIS